MSIGLEDIDTANLEGFTQFHEEKFYFMDGNLIATHPLLDQMIVGKEEWAISKNLFECFCIFNIEITDNELKDIFCSDESQANRSHRKNSTEVFEHVEINFSKCIPEDIINTDKYKELFETAAKIFLPHIASVRLMNRDENGNCPEFDYIPFVLTCGDMHRHYFYSFQIGNTILCAVSQFPVFAFARNFLETVVSGLMADVTSEALAAGLRTAYHKLPPPILGTRFNVFMHLGENALSSLPLGDIQWDYGSYLPRDRMLNDILKLPSINASLLVETWKCLLLEKKVVISTSKSFLLAPFCELACSFILPIGWVHTYLPYLPHNLKTILESPSPYLCGVDCSMDFVGDHLERVSNENKDIVVVDLDHGKVYYRQRIKFPGNLAKEMSQDIEAIFQQNLSKEFGILRPLNFTSQSSSSNDLVMQIQNYFVHQTLELLSARHCGSKAFYRDGNQKPSSRTISPKVRHLMEAQSSSSLTFSPQIFPNGNMAGILQLYSTGNDQKKKLCWCELDAVEMTVYYYADNLPAFRLPLDAIGSVAPSIEEDLRNSIFSVELPGLSTSYKFFAFTNESCTEWMEEIESCITARMNGTDGTDDISNDFSRRSLGTQKLSPRATEVSKIRDTMYFNSMSGMTIANMNDDLNSSAAVLNGNLETNVVLSEDDIQQSHLFALVRSQICDTQGYLYLKEQISYQAICTDTIEDVIFRDFTPEKDESEVYSFVNAFDFKSGDLWKPTLAKMGIENLERQQEEAFKDTNDDSADPLANKKRTSNLRNIDSKSLSPDRKRHVRKIANNASLLYDQNKDEYFQQFLRHKKQAFTSYQYTYENTQMNNFQITLGVSRSSNKKQNLGLHPILSSSYMIELGQSLENSFLVHPNEEWSNVESIIEDLNETLKQDKVHKMFRPLLYKLRSTFHEKNCDYVAAFEDFEKSILIDQKRLARLINEYLRDKIDADKGPFWKMKKSLSIGPKVGQETLLILAIAQLKQIKKFAAIFEPANYFSFTLSQLADIGTITKNQNFILLNDANVSGSLTPKKGNKELKKDASQKEEFVKQYPDFHTILNCSAMWIGESKETNPCKLVEGLLEKLTAIVQSEGARLDVRERSFSEVNVNEIHYYKFTDEFKEKVVSSSAFRSWKSYTSELQNIEIRDNLSTENEKFAFFINLYNLMVLHGSLEVQYKPSKFGSFGVLFSLTDWFSQVQYIVANMRINLLDLEHYVLKPDYRLKSPTIANYLKLSGKLSTKKTFLSDLLEKGFKLNAYKDDPLINFALLMPFNCSPFLKIISSDALQQQEDLLKCAERYLNSNLIVDREQIEKNGEQFDMVNGKVYLPERIIKFGFKVSTDSNNPLVNFAEMPKETIFRDYLLRFITDKELLHSFELASNKSNYKLIETASEIEFGVYI